MNPPNHTVFAMPDGQVYIYLSYNSARTDMDGDTIVSQPGWYGCSLMYPLRRGQTSISGAQLANTQPLHPLKAAIVQVAWEQAGGQSVDVSMVFHTKDRAGPTL